MSAMLRWAQRPKLVGDHKCKVSRAHYEAWLKQDLVFDLLRGDHPGRSFCRRFAVNDYIIENAHYSQNYHEQFINYIEKYYVQQ